MIDLLIANIANIIGIGAAFGIVIALGVLMGGIVTELWGPRRDD